MPKEWIFRISQIVWPSRKDVNKVAGLINFIVFKWRASLNYIGGWRGAGIPIKDWIPDEYLDVTEEKPV